MWAPSLGSIACAGALAVVVAACAPPDVAAPPELADDVDDFGDPEPEVPGPEDPSDGGDDIVAVELPGLPIGGFSQPISDTSQCVHVNWSGPPDIPDGVAVTVTEVAFDPPGVYAVSSDACPSADPPCLPSFPLGAEERCTLLVAWTGEPPVGEGQLFFSAGKVVCDAAAAARCVAFRDELAQAAPAGIDLEPPPTGETDADGTTETDGTTGTDGTTDVDPSDGGGGDAEGASDGDGADDGADG